MSESSARMRAANAGQSWQIEDLEQAQQDTISALRTRLVADLQNDQIDVPPLPKVAVELNRLANSPDADLQRARVLVERDPQLAGRVARLAASPAFGGRAVTGIDMAVVRLGTNGLRDIAMTVAMGKVFRCKQLDSYVRDEMRHSFLVASASRVACGMLGLEKHYGYLCGLFHDVGRLTIGIALAGYSKEQGVPLDQPVLKALANQHHEQVGSYVLSKWGLHNMVKTVAAHHHDPSKAGAAMPMALAVAAADVAARLEADDLDSRVQQLAQQPQCYQAGLTSISQIEELAQAIDDATSDDLMSSLVD